MNLILKTPQGSIKFNQTMLILTGVLSILLLATTIRGAETDSSSVLMNATVSNTVSVNVSTALTRGVLFGSLNVNSNNNLAENDTTGTDNVTEYFVGNGPTSTGSLDMWHYALNLSKDESTD